MSCPTTNNHKRNCPFCVHYVCGKQFHTVTLKTLLYACDLNTISCFFFGLITTQLRAQQNTSSVSLTSVTARNVGCVWQGAQRGCLCYDFNNCLCIEYVSMFGRLLQHSRCYKMCYSCILSHNRRSDVSPFTHFCLLHFIATL